MTCDAGCLRYSGLPVLGPAGCTSCVLNRSRRFCRRLGGGIWQGFFNGVGRVVAGASKQIRVEPIQLQLSQGECESVDKAANYIYNNQVRLQYGQTLLIAVGVIEGACRHLVKDRMPAVAPSPCRLLAESLIRLGDTLFLWGTSAGNVAVRPTPAA